MLHHFVGELRCYPGPEHAFDDATTRAGDVPTYDGDPATPDFEAAAVNRKGNDIEIFVVDGGGAGTLFPPGALRVWNLTEDGVPIVLKSDAVYGQE